MFVHSGYVHIATNITGIDEFWDPELHVFCSTQDLFSLLSFVTLPLVQLLLGLPLEIVHGPVRIGAIYLSGVVSGSLLTSITDPGEFLAGASGEIGRATSELQSR